MVIWPCLSACGGMAHHNGARGREAWWQSGCDRDRTFRDIFLSTQLHSKDSTTSHLYYGLERSLQMVLLGTSEIWTIIPRHLQQPSSGSGVGVSRDPAGSQVSDSAYQDSCFVGFVIGLYTQGPVQSSWQGRNFRDWEGAHCRLCHHIISRVSGLRNKLSSRKRLVHPPQLHFHHMLGWANNSTSSWDGSVTCPWHVGQPLLPCLVKYSYFTASSARMTLSLRFLQNEVCQFS